MNLPAGDLALRSPGIECPRFNSQLFRSGYVRVRWTSKESMRQSSVDRGEMSGMFFSRFVTKAVLTDPALVLHSFRHGGIHKTTCGWCST